MPNETVPATLASGAAPVALADRIPLEESRFEARYRLGDLLGRGGMGEVKIALDHRLGRNVALKLALGDAGAATTPAESRFVREALVQAQLEHPAVVPVYDVGLAPDGRMYLTMKRIVGRTLAEVLETRRDETASGAGAKLLDVMRRVALAVDFAHRRGVVHRDLKPANVMLGEFGEVYVLDWGVAKIGGLSSEARPASLPNAPPSARDRATGSPTADGAVIGTPGYMAPEQIAGEPLDGRTDVYALGAMLFEVLTLEPLHGDGTTEERIGSTLVGVEEAISQRLADHRAPPELVAVCTQALRLRAEDRLPDARSLADAIGRWLDGDRDLELRRELSRRRAEVAKELAEQGAWSDMATRARAIREAAHALALDPDNTEATMLLVRLLAEPPSELPREAEQELQTRLEEAETRGARRGPLALLGILGLFALLVPLGVRSWTLAALHVAGIALTALVGAFGISRFGARTKYPIFAMICLSMFPLSRAFGPLFLLPTVMISIILSFSLSTTLAQRAFVFAAGLSPVLVPLALELTGALPPSYAFRDGAMIVLPNLVSFPENLTLAALVAQVVFGGAIGVSMIGHLSRAVTDSKRQLFAHDWQLRHLMPVASNANRAA